MSRKSQDVHAGAHLHRSDTGLIFKDGLREMRFNVKQGARKLAETVETMAHAGRLPTPGPFERLGEPLGQALRATAVMLRSLDQAAVSMLANDEPWRTMNMVPHPVERYFADVGLPQSSLQDFTRDHGWRLRHWLAFAGHGDVFVHEAAVEAAGLQVRQALETAQSAGSAQVNAMVTAALLANSGFSRPLGPTGGQDDLRRLVAQGAAAAVLMGDIYPLIPEQVLPQRYRAAVQMANELVQAQKETLEQALDAADPVENLGAWFAFVQRHL